MTKKSKVLFVSISISFVFLVSLFTFLSNFAEERISDFQTYHSKLSLHTTENIAHKLEELLTQKKHLADTFVSDHYAYFQGLVEQPNNEDLRLKLQQTFKNYFEDFQAFNISDSAGTFLLSDDYFVKDQLFRADFNDYLQKGSTSTRVHTVNGVDNYDLFSRLMVENQVFHVVLSLSDKPILDHLTNSSVDGHFTLLVREDDSGWLIELTPQGSRSQLTDRASLWLTDEEKRRVLSDSIIQGTAWHVIDLPDENLFSDFASFLYEENKLLMVTFFSLLVVVNFLLWFFTRRQEFHQQALTKTNQDLEAAIHEVEYSKAENQSIINNMSDGLLVINDHGTIQSVNPACIQLFGYSTEEIIGSQVSKLIPEFGEEKVSAQIEKFIGSGSKISNRCEVIAVKHGGAEFSADLAISDMKLQGETKYFALVQDITQRKESERLKGEFVSTVSHELRTPLTSIRGSLGLVLGAMSAELNDKTKQLLTIANNNTERLLLLINDILDLSKIEAGKLDFSFKELSLVPFLQRMIESNHGYAEQHHVAYELDLQLSGAMVYADENRLGQVMSNLMSNAAKFAPDSSKVLITLARKNRKIRISVTDYGHGISDSLKPKIFQKFTQGDASDTRKVGGTGLGLSITKLMVEKHNGTIDFVSKEGVGTTFYFDLPELMVSQDSDEESDQSLEEENVKVLVIEDDHDISALIKIMLTQSGYSVTQAYSAEEAEALLENEDFSAITLDIMLPEKDGSTLYKELREKPAFKQLPIVFVSAKASEAHSNLIEDGFKDDDKLAVIDKPIDEEDLLDSLVTLVERGGKRSILHVEDDEDIQRVVRYLLADEYELDFAATLADARQKVTKQHYDLVILDLGLPDGYGWDLIALENRSLKHSKIMVYSADDVSVEELQGASKKLLKSRTSNEELKQTVRELI